jgi:alpha-beta hydrolase superfamily lysophospholipase
MFHGHGGTRSGVVAEANAFHDMGYNVCMVDFRAHGNSDGNICTIGYKEVADVIAAFDYVIAKGEKNVVLWGISLGAATILKTLNDHPEIQPSKVILEMPFGSLMEAVKGRLRLMKLPEQPFATLLTFWGGAEQGFWAFGLKPSEYAHAVKVPVLLQWGKNDSRVNESETNEIYSNIPSADKRLVVYDNSGHESLLKKEPAKWLTQVTSFLSQ